MTIHPSITNLFNNSVPELQLYILAVNELVRQPKEEFATRLKAKWSKKQLDELRNKFGDAAKIVIKVPETHKLLRRNSVDLIIEDLWLITYSYVNRVCCDKTKQIFTGCRDSAALLNDLALSYSGDPGKAFLGLLEIVKSHDEENLNLRRANIKLNNTVGALRKELDDANVLIQQLKKDMTVLGQFKYIDARDKLEQCANNNQTNAKKRQREESTVASTEESPVSAQQQQQQQLASPDVNDAEAGTSDQPYQVVQNRNYARAVKQPASNSNKSGTTSNNKKKNNNNKTINNNNNNKFGNNKSKSNRNKCIVGQAAENTSTGSMSQAKAAIKRYHYYTDSWHATTTEAEVTDWVKSNVCEILEVAKLECRSIYYSKFRITVDNQYDEKMRDPASWPRNVRVSRFTFPRNRTMNNDQRTNTSVEAKSAPSVNETNSNNSNNNENNNVQSVEAANESEEMTS